MPIRNTTMIGAVRYPDTGTVILHYEGNPPPGRTVEGIPFDVTVDRGDTAFTWPLAPTVIGGGWDFVSWNTNSAGSGDSYASGAPILMDTNKTLYAIWLDHT